MAMSIKNKVQFSITIIDRGEKNERQKFKSKESESDDHKRIEE